MRWTIALLVPAIWLLGSNAILGQGGGPQPPDKKPSAAAQSGGGPAKPASLDQLIAEAMKNNPDIRVSDAKLREAEAEAHRTRLKVAGDLTSLYADLSATRAAEEEGFARYERAKEQHRLKAIPAEDLSFAKLTWLKLQAERISVEAKLPFLLGRNPGSGASSSAIDDAIMKKWLNVGSGQDISDTEFLRRAMLDLTGRPPTPEETKDYLKLPEKERREKWIDKLLKTEPRAKLAAWIDPTASCIQCHVTPMRVHGLLNDPHLHRKFVENVWAAHFNLETKTSDKLRKALDSKIRVEIDQSSLSGILEYLREKGGLGVNIHIRAKGLKEQTVSVKLSEPVPIGAVLQYLEDELKIVFVLRDYGIVVSAAEDRLPPGAVRVVDFWKHEPPAKQPEPAEKTKTPPDKTKAEGPDGVRSITRLADMGFKVRGAVTAVGPKDENLVEISVGADAGLVKGTILEVFRLAPEAKYLGQVQIIESRSERSIARQVGSVVPSAAFQTGDQVATRLPTQK